MSRKIFINMLDTYVSQVLHQELRNDQKDEEGNDNPDANVFFSTFTAKDSSIKPEGIKKMLKVSYYNCFCLTCECLEIKTKTLYEIFVYL